MFQIEIPKRSRLCQSCEHTFVNEEAYFSTISQNEEGYAREDYCTSCWENISKKEPLAFWRGVVPKKKSEVELPKDKEERAMLLLRQILDSKDEESRMKAFYLALYLQRKKMLILRNDLLDEKGNRTYLFEVRENEEILAVPRIDLSKGAILSLQKELASLLYRSNLKVENFGFEKAKS